MISKQIVIDGLIELWDTDFILAHSFFRQHGLDIGKSGGEISHRCKHLVSTDDAKALYAVSKISRTGFAGDIDKNSALAFCKRSADKEYLPAFHWLWALYSDFLDVDVDAERLANEALYAAVDRNYPPALRSLGLKQMASNDRQSNSRGLDLLTQAAERGEACAQLIVGETLIESSSSMDVSRGIDMISSSAASGYRSALRCLSHLCEAGGHGVLKDSDRSSFLLLMSHIAEPSASYLETAASWENA